MLLHCTLGGNITDMYWVCSVDAGARFDKYRKRKNTHHYLASTIA
jgi:hypothetical protein